MYQHDPSTCLVWPTLLLDKQQGTRRDPAAIKSQAPCLPPIPLTSCPFTLGPVSATLSDVPSTEDHSHIQSSSTLLSNQHGKKWSTGLCRAPRGLGAEHLITWLFLPKSHAENQLLPAVGLWLRIIPKRPFQRDFLMRNTKKHTPQHERAVRRGSGNRKQTNMLPPPRGEGQLGEARERAGCRVATFHPTGLRAGPNATHSTCELFHGIWHCRSRSCSDSLYLLLCPESILHLSTYHASQSVLGTGTVPTRPLLVKRER